MAAKLAIVYLIVILFSFDEEVHSVAQYNVFSDFVENARGEIRGTRDHKDKDFVLGGLFPIHESSIDAESQRCDDIREETGLDLMEAMLFAIDHVSADETLLPNLTLGFDIRDTCYTDTIGLDEALELIIAGGQFNTGSCESVSEDNGTESAIPTRGIIGAAASAVSLPVATLGRLFRMPQISYSSTSTELSSYSYFRRTVLSDAHQVRAIVALIQRFNWTYISVVYDDDAYGRPMAIELQVLAMENDICIDLDEPIAQDYQKPAEKLNNSTADVVVLISSQQSAELLLQEVAKYDRKFIWIASDGWAEVTTVIHKFNESLAGMFGTMFLTQPVEDFNSCFSNMTINSNTRNPWFREFYAAVNNCTNCSNTTILGSNVKTSIYVHTVIDATYTFAHALHNFLMENCDQPLIWNRTQQTCDRQKRELNGSALLEYIQRVQFTSPFGSNTIQFDEDGGLASGSFRITNYHAIDGEYRLQKVGQWNLGSGLAHALMLNESAVQFGVDSSDNILRNPPTSGCMRCSPGKYHREIQSSCCGVCDPCLGQNYSSGTQAFMCLSCLGLGEMWGNKPLHGSDSCVPIPETFIKFSDPSSVVAVIVSTLGLIAVTATAIFFGIYWNSPVVKASGREQMVLLLIGITLSFLLVFIYVSPPSLGTCIIQRFGLWLSFSLMFGALLVKITRVTRIFLQKSSLSRVRFTEPQYQILFTFLIVLVQIMLVVASVAYVLPGITTTMRSNKDNVNNFPAIVITCVPDSLLFVLLSALYETLLVIAATALGGISFKYPENFNEAKHICFSTFVLLIIWLAFIPSYFATARSMQELQNAAISLGLALSASAILACLFVPRVYLILLKSKTTENQINVSHTGRDIHSTIGGFTLEPSLNTNTRMAVRNGTSGTNHI